VSRPALFVPAAGRLLLIAAALAVLVSAAWGGSSARDASARGAKAVVWKVGDAPRACLKLQRMRAYRKTRAGRTRPLAVRRATLRKMRRAKSACRTARKARKRRRMRRLVQPERIVPLTPQPDKPPAEPRSFRWGIVANTYGRGSGGPAEQDRVRATGVRWLREEFDSAPDAATDRVFADAARRNMWILPLLQTGSTLPDDVDAYASMVAAHVSRYGPGGSFWAERPELDASLAPEHFEIYNEPYGDWYGPVEPAKYARVLRAAVTRGREANPRARFLMAVDRTPGGERHTWIDDLYEAEPNLNDYFDAVAMHPYAVGRAPDKPDDPWGFQRIADARRVLEDHGAGSKPFWITEIGWTTCPEDPDGCVSEEEQAAYMERAAELVRTRYRFVEAMFFYHFRLDERDRSESEHFYGIVHNDLSPKPAYHALQRITGATRR
jgi:hypothetical protein